MIDIALNLTDRAFKKDLPAVIERALAAGVEHMVLTGSTLESSRDSLQLARQHHRVMSTTAGIHPHYADSATPASWQTLEQLWAEKEVCAIGECGLDYFRDLSPRPLQQEVFRKHLAAAERLQLPVLLHEREAGADMLDILGAHRDRLKDAVVHCFTNDLDVLKSYLDLDLHIGITGWICHEQRGVTLREIVKFIPDERLMIETDAPYLYPMSLTPLPRSRRNEPAFLGHICQTVADCRGQDLATVAEFTTANARRFFGLP